MHISSQVRLLPTSTT